MSFTRTAERLRRRLPVLLGRPVAVLLALSALALALWLVSPGLQTVYITERGNTTLLITRETDPEALFALSGLELEETDVYYYTSYAENVKNLSVQHAFGVSVAADGQEYHSLHTGGTVAEVLRTSGVALNEYDYTEPSLNAPVRQDTQITVHRVVYQDTVTTESIPFETEYQYTSLFYRNRSRTMVVQEGHEGTNELTWRERWVDGVFESTQQIALVTTVQPQNTIIKSYAAGAPVSSLTGPDGTTNKPSSYAAVYTGRATGYSSSSARGSSGRRLSYGTCAVNPALIPYGTLLYIESTDGRFVYGYAIAADTGTALQAGSAVVDLYYETYAEALLNAVQQVNVYVVG